MCYLFIHLGDFGIFIENFQAKMQMIAQVKDQHLTQDFDRVKTLNRSGLYFFPHVKKSCTTTVSFLTEIERSSSLQYNCKKYVHNTLRVYCCTCVLA